MAETTQGKVDSTHKPITPMAQLYSITNMVPLLPGKHTHKVELTLTKRYTCPTTIGCTRLARPTTILAIKVCQLPTSRYRTRRKGNKFHNHLHGVRSEMQRNDQLLVVQEIKQRHIRFNPNNTKLFLMARYPWLILVHKSFQLSVHKISRAATNNYAHFNLLQWTSLTVVLESSLTVKLLTKTSQDC